MEDLARHARRDTPSARPARGIVLPDPRGDIVADRARRSGTSGPPGGAFSPSANVEKLFSVSEAKKRMRAPRGKRAATRVCAGDRSVIHIET